MKNNTNNRFYTQVFWCVAGMAFLFMIAVTCRDYIVKEGKEPYLTVKEVLPVLQAFSEEYGLTVYKEEWEIRTDKKEEYVTIGEIKSFLSFFPQTEAEMLKDYKKDSWYIGVADWNGIVTELVSDYGEDTILLKDMAIIGTKRQIKDESDNPILQEQVLTDKGVYENEYWNVDNYMHSSVRAVCYKNNILTVTGESDVAIKTANVYLAGVSKEEYHFFYSGYHIRYGAEEQEFLKSGGEDFTVGELVDLSFDKGVVNIIKKDTEYINGKLVQISENGFEIEGHGIFMPAEDMAVYKLFGQLASLTEKELRIGYDFADFVLEDGRIAACLMIKDEDMEYIRVLLKNTDYAGRYHDEVMAECDQDYEVIRYEDGIETEREQKKSGDVFNITAEELKSGNIRIKLLPEVLSAKTSIKSIGRSQGIPSYKGIIEITGDESGLLVVNEVLLEDYLYNVVPSEMPSSYPKQALMAQAVCARTYAYGKMVRAGLPDLGAHVDDSAGFQVYNNINAQDSTTEAVRATHNMIAVYQGETIGTYYYSTSCGVGTDTSVWHGSGESPEYLEAQIISPDNEENDEDGSINVKASELSDEEKFREWISNSYDMNYESEEGWYRWTYTVDEIDISHMEEALQARYANNPKLILTKNENGEFESKEISSLGRITDMKITKRLPGGVADELVITGTKSVVKVISELNIRYVLSDGVTKVLRQSGDYVNATSTLPSAFMVLDTEKEDDVVTEYSVIGGGFGHGVGMSQNGAKNMAQKNMTFEEILEFFYPGTEVKTLEFGD